MENGIISEAEKKAVSIREETQIKKEEILNTEKRKIEIENKKTKKMFNENILQIETKEMASARINVRKEILEKKRELIDATYETFFEELEKEVDREELLTNLFEKGKQDLENVERVYVNKKDEEIAKKLGVDVKIKNIKGDDGKELNTKIFKKNEYFRGKCEDVAPDIVIYFDNLEYGANTSLIGNSSPWSPQTAVGSDDATHSKQGIFIINNPNQKGNLGEIDILDVAPTILSSLGISIPEEMKGKVIG